MRTNRPPKGAPAAIKPGVIAHTKTNTKKKPAPLARELELAPEPKPEKKGQEQSSNPQDPSEPITNTDSTPTQPVPPKKPVSTPSSPQSSSTTNTTNITNPQAPPPVIKPVVLSLEEAKKRFENLTVAEAIDEFHQFKKKPQSPPLARETLNNFS